ncbi:MAG: TetR/AcrR family transcriptional regulator [Gammaproteobacteria bacterium]|nr:TetR/AcrR family transcriptional regulator [Gammaproteobacteria bacterium]
MSRSVAQPRTGTAIQSPKVVARRGRIREALVQTGARMFAERGVDHVSVEELIADVGISRRTFYGFFANKYEIVADVLNALLESGAEELDALADAPPGEIVPGLVDYYLRQWDERRHALLIVGSVDRGILPYIEKAHAAFGKSMRSLLERAEAAGQLRNDSADYTFKLISRTAIQLLKVYRDFPDRARIYKESMIALLAKPGS